ncbi:MAG: hypothetical protein JOY77_07340 [Alphaproteobacteria bacterium]|nr:hypothetical protein [Alphaproteobacteria bacterium]MBV9062728.1 hypothetical protein [Alphaproteobacteria bacterium]
MLNASDHPDGELVKEVHAYFGLCMYYAQVFETGLINALTALETAASQRPLRQTFDSFYSKHEALTFGNLLNALVRHKFFPPDLLERAKALKADRDHLAHRFFRDHDLDALTVGGCYAMIEELERRRQAFVALDRQVTELEDKAFVGIGFDAGRLREETGKIMDQMLEEARALYSSTWSEVSRKV